jgi:hypothetical protein
MNLHFVRHEDKKICGLIFSFVVDVGIFTSRKRFLECSFIQTKVSKLLEQADYHKTVVSANPHPGGMSCSILLGQKKIVVFSVACLKIIESVGRLFFFGQIP